MSIFRRMLMSQFKPKVELGVAKIKMIYIVEDSNYCTVGAQGATRQALGITIDCGGLIKNITIKNSTIDTIVYSGEIESSMVCFEIYDLFPESAPYAKMSDNYIVALDENFVLENRNYYEIDMIIELPEGQERVSLSPGSLPTIDPNDTAKTPTPTIYQSFQLYQVISKTDNITILDDLWHTDAIRE